MPRNDENAPGAGNDVETFDEYSARMKTEFSAEKVYAATRGLPAAGTYTRKSAVPQAAAEQKPEASMIDTYERMQRRARMS